MTRLNTVNNAVVLSKPYLGNPPKAILATEIASVDATLTDPGGVSAGFGIKREVKVPGTDIKANLEVIGAMSINDFHNLINNNPFSVALELKLEGKVGPVGIEFQGDIQAHFKQITSSAFPKVSASGTVLFENNSSPTRVGLGWKWDSQGPGLTGAVVEQKKKQEAELSDPTNTVGAEGKVRLRVVGDRTIALKGALGGPQASGTNQIVVSGEGKVFLNVFPVTFQIKSAAGVDLKITNDGENGIWRVRLPSGQVIGQLDLPRLTDKVGALGEQVFKNAVSKARELADVIKIFNPPATANNVGPSTILRDPQPIPQIREDRYKPLEPARPIPIGQTMRHDNLAAIARRLPNSYWAVVVRGLDQVVLTAPNIDFTKKIKEVMQSNTVHYENMNGAPVKFSKDGNTLRVTSLDLQGRPVAYANVTYNTRTGVLSWKPVNLDKVFQPVQTTPEIGYTRSHDDLIKLSTQAPNSYNAYVVRGLDKVLLATQDSELSKGIKRVMRDNSGKTSLDDYINGVSVKYSNFNGSLRVAVLDPNNKEVAFATVSYDSSTNKLLNRKTGAPSWSAVNLDRAPTNQRDGGTVATAIVPVIYGRDAGLIAAARAKGPSSDAGLIVWALNEVAAAPKNSPFRKQIDSMMGSGKGSIAENFRDPQGRNVAVEWSKVEGRLQVKTTREGSAPTLHRVNYPDGNWWAVTNVGKLPNRPVDDLGSINTIITKARANGQSREGRVLHFADLMYFNAAAGDGQSNRDTLKQLSRQGYYLDKAGKVQFEVNYNHHGDRVTVSGGEGRITLAVMPSNTKSHAYSMRIAIDDKGIPILQGSAERTKDLRRADNLVPVAGIDLANQGLTRRTDSDVIARGQDVQTLQATPSTSLERASVQVVFNPAKNREVHVRTNPASGGVEVIDPGTGQLLITYNSNTTAQQISAAMSPGGPLHGRGIAVGQTATAPQITKQQEMRQPAFSV